MSFSTILVNIENHTCIITINRPEKLNALNKDVFDDLDAAINEVITNPDIKSAIITGAGAKAFVAGADIAEFAAFTKEEAMSLSQRGQNIFSKIENSPKPIIAAVNGFALGGGCELAMACHFRFCSTNAKFGQPEVNLGLIPGYGGTQRLTHLIGKGKSMEMQMTGNIIDAGEAYHLGLVNLVVEPDVLLQKAKDILQVIHAKAPIAVSKVIRCINVAVVNTGDTTGYQKEVIAFGDCFGTDDMKEGTAAFLEKRKPEFFGK